MKTRLATLSDVQTLAELATQLGYPTSPEEALARLRMMLDREDHAIYVAEDPIDGLVGWIHAYGTFLLEAEPCAEIGGLVVDESHRAKGIGRELIERVEAWARSQGYGIVRVRSNTARSGAFEFYERLGYNIIKTQHVFYKPL